MRTLYFVAVVSFFFLSSFPVFPCLISAVADWMSTILAHICCGFSANLRCRSEAGCTWLAENTGRKMSPKNRHLGTIAQLCRAIASQIRHLSTIGKKLVNQQYLFHMSSQYGKLGPLAAEIGPVVWGTLANFNGFRVLASLLQRRRLTEVHPKLCTMFGRLLGWYTIGDSSSLTEFCQVQKFTLRPSLAFFYIGSFTARHSSSGRQPKFAACYKELNYGTFAQDAIYIRLGGHHVGQRPIF